ncbi:hypothetical protein [Candidatus Parabeggiatoa sp. HSG14]|uniref:hypothetical protein n=1 Tax=Candidatus Parabeggiatoa sp. HSG14 TaxID=3055593 RepID=UPI0025A80B0B|nr:hypothetical protein [Thiotrichales bacterium HSG14]
MKTFFHRLFTTLSGFFLLIIFASLGTIYGTFSLQQIHTEARGFTNITMLGLFVDWNNRVFLTHTSNELRKNLTEDQLYKIDKIFTQLKELLKYHGAKGGLFRSNTTWWHINPRYSVQGSFQGGQFMAIITLVKQQENWAIGRFEYKYVFFPIPRHVSSMKLV